MPTPDSGTRRRSPSDVARTVARSLSMQALLLAALPANAAVTATTLIASVVRPRRSDVDRRDVASDPKTVLISGGKMTKALQLARSFHRAGHEVILVESAHYRFCGHRFSRAVAHFHTIPEPGAPDYVDALLAIVGRHGVDVFVPVCSPAASYHDAMAKEALSRHCEVIHVGPQTLTKLDDKYEFAMTATSLGLAVPDTHRITAPQQVLDFDFTRPDRADRTYVLKSIPYDPVRRLDLTPLPRPTPEETAAFVETLPISDDVPWILQEFVVGTEYCTHGTVRGGDLQLHCCCESSAFQINYEMVDKPEIEKWVRTFVEALAVTGQVSLDFIESADGTVYAIECNPRTHSAITMFHDHPDVARAYFDDGVPTVTPLPSSRPTYWLYHELWRMVTNSSTALERWRVVRRGKDAIFDRSDPLPFLMVHHVHIPSLLLGNLHRLADWIRIDFNIGKLVEVGGD